LSDQGKTNQGDSFTMSDSFPDRLVDAIQRRQSPICVGIDPILESLPPSVRDASPAGLTPTEAAVDAIYDFSSAVLKVVAPLVPIVKLQSAYFEKYRWEGIEAFYTLVREARELGLLVIGDVKRGDIASTADAYAAGHLDEVSSGEGSLPDAITINPMLGLDTVQPFLQVAAKNKKGLFVLVRTSNPGSAQLQDAKLSDGRTWSEALADQLAQVAGADGLVGKSGYSVIGAVVGATQEHTMASLRNRLPQSIFLLPGYGTQGATAAQTRAAFKNGRGAIISASRSILYAHSQPQYAAKFGGDWRRCVEQAVLDMKQDVQKVLNN
jgi:orotidine-5'-phosphate decarboxylase